ncbi:hypothetical protein D3C80_990080 [compost metagenome]
MLDKIATAQARQQLAWKDPRLRRARVDFPVAGAARTVEHNQRLSCCRIAALCQQGSIDKRHHRLIQVQGLPLGVHGQGVDPGNTLQSMHRVLQRFQAVSLVHAVPLLQYASVVQVGVAQAESVLLVPVQPSRPLDYRAEH